MCGSAMHARFTLKNKMNEKWLCDLEVMECIDADERKNEELNRFNYG